MLLIVCVYIFLCDYYSNDKLLCDYFHTSFHIYFIKFFFNSICFVKYIHLYYKLIIKGAMKHNILLSLTLKTSVVILVTYTYAIPAHHHKSHYCRDYIVVGFTTALRNKSKE